jgi:hypothetical protein
MPRGGSRLGFQPLAMLRLRLAILFLAFVLDLRAAPALRVGVTDSMLRFSWTEPKTSRLEIRELALDDGAAAATVWSGDATAGSAEVPRLDGKRDRLFARFELRDAASGKPLGDPQYATDFSAAAARTQSLDRPTSKKGVGCVVNFDDVVALGAAWVKIDIDIANLIDWSSADPKMSFEYDGRRVGLKPQSVARLDRQMTESAQHGMGVVGVLLNYVPKTPGAEKSPLVHPRTNPAQVPMGPAAFNTATAEGLFHYRAVVHWLIDRYTEPGSPHGRMSDLVIGNELQSHWMWYNMGEASQDDVLHAYHKAVRIADLAARSIHRDFRIFVSMEHHWAMRGDSEDELREISGVEFLRGLGRLARAGGDFPWHVAFHPYPESLFEPRFWNDRTAPLRLDAPRVTFRNLEVLAAFLHQPDMQYDGKPRRIALTEQGFHCGKGPDAEDVQAAAFAYAWKRVAAIPDIDIFLYHRHSDHPHEGGLRLGLRAHDGSPNPAGMGEKRKLWDVFRDAGTDREDAAFAFALPIVGRKDWSDITATKLDNTPVPKEFLADGIVFDFVARRRAAVVQNTLAFELRHIVKDAGWLAHAIQQHPKSNVVSTADWEVDLPAGKPLALAFTALLNKNESTGATFAVKIDGEEKWRQSLKGGESAPARLDISSLAGKKVRITFAIDPQGPSQNDWATWVQPKIVGEH